MIKGILVAWLGSALLGTLVFQGWLDAQARYMGEPVIFDAATFAFFYGMILIYTAILGVPLALGIHWLLQKLRLSNALVYVGVGATISLLLVALTRPYGLGTFFRHGGDGIANSIIVIGVSASALFWWIAVRPHRLAGTGV